MQNFITTFHSVQEIAPLSLFQDLELGKASTDEKYHFAISWARSCQFQRSHFQNLVLGKASTDDKCHFAIPWARSYQYQCVCKILFYQNIPNGLRVKFHFFHNLNLGKTATNPKCHLTISGATSCQYQCVCKILSQYSTQFKR